MSAALARYKCTGKSLPELAMSHAQSLPIIVIEEGQLAAAGLAPARLAWAMANGFSGQRGRLLALPGDDGAVTGYLFGIGEPANRSALVMGLAGATLPAGDYHLEGAFGDPVLAVIGFRLGAYRFAR